MSLNIKVIFLSILFCFSHFFFVGKISQNCLCHHTKKRKSEYFLKSFFPLPKMLYLMQHRKNSGLWTILDHGIYQRAQSAYIDWPFNKQLLFLIFFFLLPTFFPSHYQSDSNKVIFVLPYHLPLNLHYFSKLIYR